MPDIKTPQLSDLENQLDRLINLLERERVENKSLRDKLTQSINDRANLQQKNKKAATAIKQIVAQLKEEIK